MGMQEKVWPTQRGIVLDPAMEGVTYINVYSKAKRPLGKRLSNLAIYPSEHPVFGRFDTIEGLWWFLATGAKDDRFRTWDGFTCRTEGKKEVNRIKRETNNNLFRGDFQTRIKQGIAYKLLAHQKILNELLESDLPLVHYYAYKSGFDRVDVTPANNSLWVIHFLEEIRETEGKVFDAIIGAEQHKAARLAGALPEKETT